MSKFKVGDKVKVKPESQDYHLSGMTGVYEVTEVIHRSRRWTQYEIEADDDNWEVADEEDIELTPDQGKE